MTGFTLIWFNSCQLWAPSRCLFFSRHLDRFGPDNAQLLEIFLDISHQWGSGVLYQKYLFPGTGSSGELCSTDVTRLLAYRIHMQHEYTAHFEICNRFQFCLTLLPDSLLGNRLWGPGVEIIHSHLVSNGHFVMATAGLSWCRRRTHTSQRCGRIECRSQETHGQKLRGKWRLHPWARLPLNCCDVLTLLHTSAAQEAGHFRALSPRGASASLCTWQSYSVFLEKFFTSKFMDCSDCWVSPNHSLQNLAY